MVDYCDNCGSANINEFNNGDVICCECGYVHNADEEE